MATVEKDAQEIETALGLTSEIVALKAESVTVNEFTLEQLPELLRLMDEMRQAGKTIATLTNKETGQSDDYIQDDFVHGLLQSGDTGIKLLMLATGKDRAWFKRTGIAAAPPLARALFRVNKGFFDQLSDLITEASGMAESLKPKPVETPTEESIGQRQPQHWDGAAIQ